MLRVSHVTRQKGTKAFSSEFSLVQVPSDTIGGDNRVITPTQHGPLSRWRPREIVEFRGPQKARPVREVEVRTDAIWVPSDTIGGETKI